MEFVVGSFNIGQAGEFEDPLVAAPHNMVGRIQFEINDALQMDINDTLPSLLAITEFRVRVHQILPDYLDYETMRIPGNFQNDIIAPYWRDPFYRGYQGILPDIINNRVGRFMGIVLKYELEQVEYSLLFLSVHIPRQHERKMEAFDALGEMVRQAFATYEVGDVIIAGDFNCRPTLLAEKLDQLQMNYAFPGQIELANNNDAIATTPALHRNSLDNLICIGNSFQFTGDFEVYDQTLFSHFPIFATLNLIN